MDAENKKEIEEAIIEIILAICPEAALVPKYGGKMVEAVAGDASTQFGGFFFYKSHMSFEFGRGAELVDKNGVLEGKGKYRRHIKIVHVEEIEEKALDRMIRQAIERI